MINLLPSHIREGIATARLNTRLLKWVVAVLGATLGVIFIVGLGLFYMNRSIRYYSAQVEQTQAELKTQKLEETQKRVDEISKSLKLVVQVLSREVLFSELLKQIGTVVPTNASLTDLRIGKIEGAIDLTAATADYNTATQLQVNLQDPANKIFEKVDIVNITCNSNTAVDPRYPCTANLRALFAKNNPFLFINNKGGS